jgi:hypothetical protein
VASAAPPAAVASASPASSAPESALPPPAAVSPPIPAPPGQLDLIDLARSNWGWLVALAALAGGAAAAGWTLSRRPSVASLAPVLAPASPVTVTVSLAAAPRSTLQNVHPGSGPAISIAWRVDPPKPRIESLTPPEEPKP